VRASGQSPDSDDFLPSAETLIVVQICQVTHFRAIGRKGVVFVWLSRKVTTRLQMVMEAGV
jgi:hypothetical protein